MKYIGFDSLVDDISNEDSKHLNYQDDKVVVRTNKQHFDIWWRVRRHVSTGDKILMFEYANDGTEDAVTDVCDSVVDGHDQTTRLR